MYSRILTRGIHVTAIRSLEKETMAYTYTKQTEYHPDPKVSGNGHQMYVVAPKETSSYDVPGGAYATADPYAMPHEKPAPKPAPTSSTSAGIPHPITTSRTPRASA